MHEWRAHGQETQVRFLIHSISLIMSANFRPATDGERIKSVDDQPGRFAHQKAIGQSVEEISKATAGLYSVE